MTKRRPKVLSIQLQEFVYIDKTDGSEFVVPEMPDFQLDDAKIESGGTHEHTITLPNGRNLTIIFKQSMFQKMGLAGVLKERKQKLAAGTEASFCVFNKVNSRDIPDMFRVTKPSGEAKAELLPSFDID